nr:unnamed protein product [Digitaria exilis]
MAEEVKHLETARADRRMWLMKCPTVVSRAWQEAAATSNPEAGGANPNPVVAKVVLSLDLLRDEQPTKARLLLPSAPYILWSREKKKPVPQKPFEMKRTRRNRTDMENILFKLFERQPNWSLKQLMQETDQPEQFLKEILNDLCVYNKRGPNQGTHELKPEYKKSAEDSNAT